MSEITSQVKSSQVKEIFSSSVILGNCGGGSFCMVGLALAWPGVGGVHREPHEAEKHLLPTASDLHSVSGHVPIARLEANQQLSFVHIPKTVKCCPSFTGSEHRPHSRTYLFVAGVHVIPSDAQR